MRKKLLAMVICTVLGTIALAGCSSDNKTTETDSETKSVIETSAAEGQESSTSSVSSNSNQGGEIVVEGNFKIGISQFAQHGSLDNCREGFIEGLSQEGFTEGMNLEIVYQNAEADTMLATQIAQNYVATKVDLICAIATPSAQSAFNAAKESDIPTIYTAVTDPVIAGLANEDMSPVGNITGTSDKLPVEAQLKMIREILPEAKTIGIMYTTSEANSESAIKEYQAVAADYGFELEIVGINSLADVSTATDSLLTKVDCLNNLTDNTVVSALPTILNKANQKNIPVFGSEIEQVKMGCLASEGIDYYQLGIDTGVMAAKVLKGEVQASDMNYQSIETSNLYLNSQVAEQLGITIPDDIKTRAIESSEIE